LSDLKGELASLRIDRERPARSPWRWPLLLLVPVALGLLGLYVLRAVSAARSPEVETVRAVASQAGGTSPGSAILTASGYVVARRKAVVSAKIQGRLAELRVEEGSRVRRGELIARLESNDYEAQVKRAQAAVQRAHADLNEAKRLRVQAERLAAEQIFSTDQVEVAQSREQVALPDELPGGDPIEAETFAVLDVIRGLPEAYRDTLLMRLVEGMSGQEIADRTGLAPGSVRVNLHRGMKLLRDKLGLET